MLIVDLTLPFHQLTPELPGTPSRETIHPAARDPETAPYHPSTWSVPKRRDPVPRWSSSPTYFSAMTAMKVKRALKGCGFVYIRDWTTTKEKMKKMGIPSSTRSSPSWNIRQANPWPFWGENSRGPEILSLERCCWKVTQPKLLLGKFGCRTLGWEKCWIVVWCWCLVGMGKFLKRIPRRSKKKLPGFLLGSLLDVLLCKGLSGFKKNTTEIWVFP